MAVQKVFKRYEYKYLLTREQKELLQNVMEEYMIPDEYGKSTICNLYFDTPQYLLIRRSIENKVYKEKVRLRTYGRAEPAGEAFIELKKKYKKSSTKANLYGIRKSDPVSLPGRTGCRGKSDRRRTGLCSETLPGNPPGNVAVL